MEEGTIESRRQAPHLKYRYDPLQPEGSFVCSLIFQICNDG
jgi:hypothetical protein